MAGYDNWGNTDPMAGPSLANLLSQITAEWGYNPGNVERAAAEAAVRGAGPGALAGVMGLGQQTLNQREQLAQRAEEAQGNQAAQIAIAGFKAKQAAIEAALQRQMKYDLADEQNSRMRDYYSQLGQRWNQDRATKEAMEAERNQTRYGVQDLRNTGAMDRARLRSDTQMDLANLLEGGRNTRFDTGQTTKRDLAGMQDQTRRELFSQGQEGSMARLLERLATQERGQDYQHTDREERNRILDSLGAIRERLGMARNETTQRGQDINQGLGEGKLKLGYDTLGQNADLARERMENQKDIAELNAATRLQISKDAGIKLTSDQQMRLDALARQGARGKDGKVNERLAVQLYQEMVKDIRGQQSTELNPPIEPKSVTPPQGTSGLWENPVVKLGTAPLDNTIGALRWMLGM